MENKKTILGSQIAKSGFDNERLIIDLLNNWKKEDIGRNLLKKMGIDLNSIKSLKVQKAHPRNKADIVLVISESNQTKKHNISIKKYGYSLSADGRVRKFNYNQIDKRTIDKAKERWKMPEDIANNLRKFVGEEGFTAKELLKKGEISRSKYDSLRDKRRIFLDEMNKSIQNKIIDFFYKNKKKIVSDIIKGDGESSADWFLVDETELNQDKTIKKINRITIISIQEAIDLFSFGNISLTNRGNLKIGKITLQRKGGTPDPSKLQFKINPECVLENFWENERKLY